MALRILFRIVAIIAAPFALFQYLGPLAEVCIWLRDAADPNIEHVRPTGFEIFVLASRQMVYCAILLAVPLVLWLAGECSAKLAKLGNIKAE